jgi:hypothetical protein
MHDRLPIKIVVLNSWKEIANYLGRGVRTVQRWERELGLPVRRPRGKDRSAVMAIQQELDDWLLQSSNNKKALHPDFNPMGRAQLQKNTGILLARTDELLSRSRRLWLQVNHMRQLTSVLRARQFGFGEVDNGISHFFNTRHFKPESPSPHRTLEGGADSKLEE